MWEKVNFLYCVFFFSKTSRDPRGPRPPTPAAESSPSPAVDIHGGCNSRTLDNDFAIVRLASSVTFTDRVKSTAAAATV